MTIFDAYHNTYSWGHRITIYYIRLLMTDWAIIISSFAYNTSVLSDTRPGIHHFLHHHPSSSQLIPDIQCYSHKGQVCVSSSVSKSDSQGLEKANISRGPGTYDCLSWPTKTRQHRGENVPALFELLPKLSNLSCLVPSCSCG